MKIIVTNHPNAPMETTNCWQTVNNFELIQGFNRSSPNSTKKLICYTRNSGQFDLTLLLFQVSIKFFIQLGIDANWEPAIAGIFCLPASDIRCLKVVQNQSPVIFVLKLKSDNGMVKYSQISKIKVLFFKCFVCFYWFRIQKKRMSSRKIQLIEKQMASVMRKGTFEHMQKV